MRGSRYYNYMFNSLFTLWDFMNVTDNTCGEEYEFNGLGIAELTGNYYIVSDGCLRKLDRAPWT